MKLRFIILIVGLVLISCHQAQIESVRVEKWRVDTIWKRPIIGVDDEINPNSYIARLSNGDSVPVARTCQIGDTVEYRFVKFKKETR